MTLSDGKEIRLDDQGYTHGPLRARTAPTARWSSTTSGRATRRSRTRSARRSRRRSRATCSGAKARHYDSALQAALDGGNVPEAVYRSLIAETNRGLPVLHRYFELRRRMLGLPDMGYWDIYPPLVKSDRSYSLAEMRGLTIDAIKPLGPDYVALFSDVERAAVDGSVARGRARRRARTWTRARYDVHPYLLLNLSDKYDGADAPTRTNGATRCTALIANAAQPYELSNYPTFTAEVASTLPRAAACQHDGRACQDEGREAVLPRPDHGELSAAPSSASRCSPSSSCAINDLATKGEGLSGEKMAAIYLDLLQALSWAERADRTRLCRRMGATSRTSISASTSGNMRPRSPPRTTSRRR